MKGASKEPELAELAVLGLGFTMRKARFARSHGRLAGNCSPCAWVWKPSGLWEASETSSSTS